MRLALEKLLVMRSLHNVICTRILQKLTARTKKNMQILGIIFRAILSAAPVLLKIQPVPSASSRVGRFSVLYAVRGAVEGMRYL